MSQQPFEHSLGFILNDVSRLLRTRFDQRARRYGLTRSQWRVLVHLVRAEGIIQSGLAEILEIERMTLGRLIDRLESAGWVERRSDAKDRRVRRLFLTAAARPTLDDMMQIVTDMHDEALSGLSSEELNRLMTSLTIIKGNLIEMTTNPDQEIKAPVAPIDMAAADD
ncbi:MAG: MarR family transcriptional regulator [Alphaproteobacteria bacterium]|nr:MarR family transcriptional regulator [Alphaproteobacteria bacterium]